MAQKQREKAKTAEADIEETTVPEPKEFDIDSVLDEIDGVLEQDAQKFVEEYVQKGGQ